MYNNRRFSVRLHWRTRHALYTPPPKASSAKTQAQQEHPQKQQPEEPTSRRRDKKSTSRGAAAADEATGIPHAHEHKFPYQRTRQQQQTTGSKGSILRNKYDTTTKHDIGWMAQTLPNATTTTTHSRQANIRGINAQKTTAERAEHKLTFLTEVATCPVSKAEVEQTISQIEQMQS